MSARGWCVPCNGVEPVARVVDRPRWKLLPIPHWDFSPHEVWLCENGHALSALCIECGKAKAEFDDYCQPCAEKNFDDWQIEDFRRDQAAQVRALVQQ